MFLCVKLRSNPLKFTAISHDAICASEILPCVKLLTIQFISSGLWFNPDFFRLINWVMSIFIHSSQKKASVHLFKESKVGYFSSLTKTTHWNPGLLVFDVLIGHFLQQICLCDSRSKTINRYICRE